MRRPCVVRFVRQLEHEKVIVMCSCGWSSAPVFRRPPVTGGPSAATVAFVHIKASEPEPEAL